MDEKISRYQDSNGRRHYTRGDEDVLSVTTVLDELEEDKTGLRKWKDSNDGEGDNANHEHLYWYSAPRGTLCHYQALAHFEDAYEGDDMWGKEETESLRQILNGPEDGSFELNDAVYSVMKNQGRVDSRAEYNDLFSDTTLADINRRDCEYFVEAFKEICDKLGVDDLSIISIEKYLLNTEDGYGGQCDMVYEDPFGNIVVADLKTSSSLREKHRLQAVAYGKAVENDDDIDVFEVDRYEVWRIDPDSQTWQVHSNSEPMYVRDLANDGDKPWTDSFSTHGWFEDPWGSFSYNSIDEMWQKFKELCEKAHNEPEANKHYNSDGV